MLTSSILIQISPTDEGARIVYQDEREDRVLCGPEERALWLAVALLMRLIAEAQLDPVVTRG